jgi:hypothetical protein
MSKQKRLPKTKKKSGDWYVKARYGHFDKALEREEAEAIVLNPKVVAQHRFLPFLQRVTKTRKLSRARHGKGPKKRPIAYASHQDAAIYSYYNLQLGGQYEEVLKGTPLHGAVLAYRALDGQCNIHFAKQAFDEIRKRGSCVAVACDLQDFFETLGHKEIKEQWQRVMKTSRLPPDHFAVYENITQYKIVDAEKASQALEKKPYRDRWWAPMKEIRAKVLKDKSLTKRPPWAGLKEGEVRNFGVPQGSPMSGLLANLVMLPCDEQMMKWAEANGGKYWRYSDDVLWVGPVGSEGAFLQELRKNVRMAGPQLMLNDGKTEITTFTPDKRGRLKAVLDKGGQLYDNGWLQYLGFMFDGNVVRIRHSSLAKYYRRLKARVGLAFYKAISSPRPGSELPNGRHQVFERGIWSHYAFNGASRRMTFPKYVHKCAAIFGSKDAKAMRAQIRKAPKVIKEALDVGKRLDKKIKRRVNNQKRHPQPVSKRIKAPKALFRKRPMRVPQ